MNRRNFLKTSLVAAGAATVGARGYGTPAIVSSEARRDRPNILFIFTDQQQADALSCAGMAGLRTPAMDSLAARGVRFTRTYAFQPLCVPSRTSIMTGLPPRHFGTRVNNLEPRVPSDAATLGRLMTGAGYDTAYVGKWHLPMALKDTASHGFATLRGIANGGHIDTHIAGPCDAILRQSRSRPLFLAASIVNPHDVCEYAAGFHAPNGDLPPRPAPADCPPLPANHARSADEPSALTTARALTPLVYPTGHWTEDRWRQYVWGYHRFIEKADTLVGHILDSLATSGRERDTLVVFSSDHGEGGGAHRWNQKTVLYDEAVRVPFIVAGPGVQGAGRVDDRSLVSLGLDFLPTACAYAGAAVPAGCPGRSLQPLIEGARPAWRDHVVAESEFQADPNGAQPSGIRGRMVRSDRFKYVVYSEGTNREQLFDLASDPGERVNLVRDAAHAGELGRHRAWLTAWGERTADDFPRAG